MDTLLRSSTASYGQTADRFFSITPHWSESRATVPLGVGHVMRVSKFWWGGGHVSLPLHEQAGAEPWGWFADGWQRLRYSRPSDDPDGTAWVHRCHLTREGLAFEPWEERFLSDEISPLYFRARTPRPLHPGPDDEAEVIARIDGDYHLEPLNFQGDWMRVRLKTPSDYRSLDPLALGRSWAACLVLHPRLLSTRPASRAASSSQPKTSASSAP